MFYQIHLIRLLTNFLRLIPYNQSISAMFLRSIHARVRHSENLVKKGTVRSITRISHVPNHVNMRQTRFLLCQLFKGVNRKSNHNVLQRQIVVDLRSIKGTQSNFSSILRFNMVVQQHTNQSRVSFSIKVLFRGNIDTLFTSIVNPHPRNRHSVLITIRHHLSVVNNGTTNAHVSTTATTHNGKRHGHDNHRDTCHPVWALIRVGLFHRLLC